MSQAHAKLPSLYAREDCESEMLHDRDLDLGLRHWSGRLRVAIVPESAGAGRRQQNRAYVGTAPSLAGSLLQYRLASAADMFVDRLLHFLSAGAVASVSWCGFGCR